MSGEDVAKLRDLGIRVICDLRSHEESRKRQPRGLSIRLVNIPLHEQHAGGLKDLYRFLFRETGEARFREFLRGYYHHIAFEQTARIGEVVRLISEECNLPALIHCRAGKDRTGLVAALIQLVLGVSYEDVRAGYLRSNDYFEPRLNKFIRVVRAVTFRQVPERRIRMILMAHAEYLDEVYEGILGRYGSVEEYIQNGCGIDALILERLRRLLLA